MATKLIKYPLDETGTSPTNLVLDELHIVPRGGSRIFATNYGPYYSDSLVVREKGRVTPLQKDTHYKLIELDPDATLDLGMSVSSAVMMLDDTLNSNIIIEYQVVGGNYSLSAPAIQLAFERLELDARKVAFVDLIGVPVRFPPSPHLHDAKDLYGMEYVVDAIHDLAKMIQTGDITSHELIYDYIDRVKGLIYIDIDGLDRRITANTLAIDTLNRRLDTFISTDFTALSNDVRNHIADRNNPHNVTKTQVGLSNVPNYAAATNTQGMDVNNTTSFVTPGVMWYALNQAVVPKLNAHLADYNNPHQVSKAQTGLGNVENFPMASMPEAIAHALATRYMSPATTWGLIDATVGASLRTHVADWNNPHKVSKAQVGLGSVENYPMASDQEAIVHTNAARYLSPVSGWALINATVGADLRNHTADRNNPHGVTATQVNLGNVPNYPAATDQEAISHTLATRLMTPTSSWALINATVGADLRTHVADRNNPHRVTTTQIGAVPVGRRINGMTLEQDRVLGAGDVGAYTKAEVDALFATNSGIADVALGGENYRSNGWQGSRMPVGEVVTGTNGFKMPGPDCHFDGVYARPILVKEFGLWKVVPVIDAAGMESQTTNNKRAFREYRAGSYTLSLSPGEYSLLAVGAGGGGGGIRTAANYNPLSGGSGGGYGAGGGSGKAFKARLTVAAGDVITVDIGAAGRKEQPGGAMVIRKNGTVIMTAPGGTQGGGGNGGAGGSGGGSGTSAATSWNGGATWVPAGAGAGGTNGTSGGGVGGTAGGAGMGSGYYDQILQSVDPTILHFFAIGGHGAGGAGRVLSGAAPNFGSIGGGAGGMGTISGIHNWAGKGYGGGGSAGPADSDFVGNPGIVSIINIPQ